MTSMSVSESESTTSTPPHPSIPPYRQIRALYTPTTITVYQAYSSAIALPAVEHQLLSASPSFKTTRMTWVKPSWCWMMYRCGYSFKDERQERVLALEMKREGFERLLREAGLSHGANADKAKQVRVQWDPERTPSLQQLPYRSIQIGIGPGLVKEWIEEMVVGIEDVTERARRLKAYLEESPGAGLEELVKMGLVPEEKEYIVGEDIRTILGMDIGEVKER